ncbi:unnamed protein product [Merluccius merluccius]
MRPLASRLAAAVAAAAANPPPPRITAEKMKESFKLSSAIWTQRHRKEGRTPHGARRKTLTTNMAVPEFLLLSLVDAHLTNEDWFVATGKIGFALI